MGEGRLTAGKTVGFADNDFMRCVERKRNMEKTKALGFGVEIC